MSDSVAFEFRNLQQVRIRDIDARGFVFSRIANAENQNEFKVRYWMDGKRSEDWFYAFELEAA